METWYLKFIVTIIAVIIENFVAEAFVAKVTVIWDYSVFILAKFTEYFLRDCLETTKKISYFKPNSTIMIEIVLTTNFIIELQVTEVAIKLISNSD